MEISYADNTASLKKQETPMAIKYPICQHCLRAIVPDTIYIDPSQPLVLWKGTNINVTKGEWRVVALLINKAPNAVTYTEVYAAMRGKENFHCHDTGANVRSQIKRIRRKFTAADPTFDGIKNVTGFGYAWAV